MKNKFLLILLVIFIISTFLVAMVACTNKKQPNDNDENKNKDKIDNPDDEIKKVTFQVALDSVISGLEGVVDFLGEAHTKIHGGGTIYFNIAGSVGLEVTIQGNFETIDPESTAAARNNALLDIKVNKGGSDALKSILTVYVTGDVIYIGEALTQEAFSWMKLEQFKEAAILSYYFAKLPGIIAGFPAKDVGDIIGSAGAASILSDCFGVDSSDFDADNPKSININTELEILITTLIGKLGSLFKILGIDVEDGVSLESITSTVSGLLGFDAAPLFDILANSIFNVSPEQLFGAEPITEDDKLPTIKIISDVKEGKTKQVGLYYKNDNFKLLDDEGKSFELSLGIKDLVLNENVVAISAPSGLNISTVGNAYLQANVNLNLPLLNDGTEVDITIFADPAIKVQWEDSVKKDSVKVDFTSARAWAYGKITEGDAEYEIYGEYVYNEELEKGVFALNLTGLKEFLGYTDDSENIPEALQKPYYYLGFDLDELFYGSDDVNSDSPLPVAPIPNDAEGEPTLSDFDTVIGLIEDLFNGDSSNILSLIMTGLNVIKGDILPAFTAFEEAIEKEDKSVTIALATIRELLDKNENFAFIKDSTYLKDGITKFINDPAQLLADYIEEGIEGYTKGDLYDLIGKALGIEALEGYDDMTEDDQKTADAIIDTLALTLTGIRPATDAESGVGFGIAIKFTLPVEGGNPVETTALSFKATIDIKGGSYDQAIAACGYISEKSVADVEDFSGYWDLDEDGVFDSIVDLIEIILDKYTETEQSSSGPDENVA